MSRLSNFPFDDAFEEHCRTPRVGLFELLYNCIHKPNIICSELLQKQLNILAGLRSTQLTAAYHQHLYNLDWQLQVADQ